MRGKFKHLIILIFGIVIFSSGANSSFAQSDASKRPGEIYLLRGLANVFSLGMDKMSSHFKKRGFTTYVYNHSYWQGLADDIIERERKGRVSYPIIIIGHSLGAGAAPKMATMLGRRNIPVTYVVMLDPVETSLIGRNVDEVINYYLPKKNNSNVIIADDDFEGKLENINVRPYGDITHLNIHIDKRMLKLIYDRTLEISDTAMAGSEVKN